MFTNDYGVICHPEILKAIEKENGKYQIPYGLDPHTDNAEKEILEKFGLKDSSVYFLAGGTQTNLTVISHCLKDYECVIAVRSGHINVHETGAIESTGHKVYTVEGVNGKITKELIEEAVKYHSDFHMVKPKMVYISNATEIGTIYSKTELSAIYKCCKDNNLYLYIDGARLGCALTSKENDLSCKEFASLCDVFYIGGTKNGLLFGEAVVINNKEINEEFRYQIKNKGSLLAKGYITGIMFERAFMDNLYFDIALHANKMSYLIQDGLVKLGYKFNYSPANQIFIKLDNNKANAVIEKFGCEIWSKQKDYTEIRIVTCFNTKVEEVNALLDFMK